MFSFQNQRQQKDKFRKNKKIIDCCFSFSFLSYIRCERQCSFLPVIHLRGNSSWRSRDRHISGSGVGHRPGLWSARDGETRLHLQWLLVKFLFFSCLSIFCSFASRSTMSSWRMRVETRSSSASTRAAGPSSLEPLLTASRKLRTWSRCSRRTAQSRPGRASRDNPTQVTHTSCGDLDIVWFIQCFTATRKCTVIRRVRIKTNKPLLILNNLN